MPFDASQRPTKATSPGSREEKPGTQSDFGEAASGPPALRKSDCVPGFSSLTDTGFGMQEMRRLAVTRPIHVAQDSDTTTMRSARSRKKRAMAWRTGPHSWEKKRAKP